MPTRSSSALRGPAPIPPRRRAEPPASLKLARWQRLTLYGLVAFLTLTGAAWLVCRHLLAEQGEYGPLPHPTEALWLALHGAGAMLALVVFGWLLASHVVRAWELQRGRPSGSGVVAAFALLTLTGYALYYVGDDVLRSWLSLLHWGIGLGLPALIGVHVWERRRKIGV